MMNTQEKIQYARKLLDFRNPFSKSDFNHFAEAFNLTRSELKVTLLLAEGYTILQISNLLTFTEDTVRAYTKRIYCKTYVHSQAQLVRLVFLARDLKNAIY